jgi:hypothetical protein
MAKKKKNKRTKNKITSSSKSTNSGYKQVGYVAPKLHGVATEEVAQEQITRTGTYPFTFKSAFLITGAAVVGGILFPFLADMMGGDVRLVLLVGLTVTMAPAIAVSRYFFDSNRGICQGFWITLVIMLVAISCISYLLLYKGILV